MVAEAPDLFEDTMLGEPVHNHHKAMYKQEQTLVMVIDELAVTWLASSVESCTSGRRPG